MQRTLRKIKQHLDENEYRRMYPTGSRPGLFYTTAKVHKLQSGEGLNELTMRPIVSNIGTATYETAKFLNSLLAPLGKSDRSILNTEAFVKQVKGQRIPDKKMISFDVKNLFTNVLERDGWYYFNKSIWWKENRHKNTKVIIKRATVSLHEACALQIQ